MELYEHGYVATCSNKKARCETASHLALVVEMRGSRTPCPIEPTGEYATGLVDIFSYTTASHRPDAVRAGPLVLNDG